jgi:peptidoglycan/LPS O-acetylase OafA/YrhL
VSISGTGAVTATLTISTTAAGGCTQAYQIPRGVFWYTGGGAILACLMLFGIQARRRRWRLALAMLALLVTLMGGWLACGGTSSPPCTPTPGTTPGSYTITVTGTSGATTATGPVTLTVQ